MAIYKEDITDVDLDTGNISRSFVNKSIGESDANGDRFGVRCIRNKQPVDLTGYTVTGYFIRSNGTSVIIQGTASGSKAYVELPASCYVIEGTFSLAIKLTGQGKTATVRIVDGTVVNTVIGSVVDPGGIVPDLSELLAVIGRAEDAAETIGDFAITEQLIEGDDYRLIINVE